MTDDATPPPPADGSTPIRPDDAPELTDAAGPGDPADDPAPRGSAASRSEAWASTRTYIDTYRPTLFGVALALLLVVAAARLGFLDEYGKALQVMGFDPDRAALITSLLVGAMSSAIVAVAGGRFWVAVVTGAGVALVAIYQVFREATRAAMRSQAPDATFDPLGWGLSALTLATISLFVAWAAAVLGRDVASRLNVVGGAAGELAARRGLRGRAAGHLVAAVAIIALLAVAIPIFVDMLKSGPGSHMRR